MDNEENDGDEAVVPTVKFLNSLLKTQQYQLPFTHLLCKFPI